MEHRPPTIQTSQFYGGNAGSFPSQTIQNPQALSNHLRGVVSRTNKNLETGMPLGNVNSLSLVGPGSFNNQTQRPNTSSGGNPVARTPGGGAAAAAVFQGTPCRSPMRMINSMGLEMPQSAQGLGFQNALGDALDFQGQIQPLEQRLQGQHVRGKSYQVGRTAAQTPGSAMGGQMNSIESRQELFGRNNQLNILEPDFATIQVAQVNAQAGENVSESEVIQRMRVFEDVIIQRIKVIQDFVRRMAKQQISQQKKQSKSQQQQYSDEKWESSAKKQNYINPAPQIIQISKGDEQQLIDLDGKIEEAVRWKLEAMSEKLKDRFTSNESNHNQMKKHIQEIQSQNESDFEQLRNTVLQTTEDILEQVQTQILPQAESNQQDQMIAFRNEIKNILTPIQEGFSRQQLLDQKVKELSSKLSTLDSKHGVLNKAHDQTQACILEQTTFHDQMEAALRQASSQFEDQHTNLQQDQQQQYKQLADLIESQNDLEEKLAELTTNVNKQISEVKKAQDNDVNATELSSKVKGMNQRLNEVQGELQNAQLALQQDVTEEISQIKQSIDQTQGTKSTQIMEDLKKVQDEVLILKNEKVSNQSLESKIEDVLKLKLKESNLQLKTDDNKSASKPVTFQVSASGEQAISKPHDSVKLGSVNQEVKEIKNQQNIIKVEDQIEEIDDIQEVPMIASQSVQQTAPKPTNVKQFSNLEEIEEIPTIDDFQQDKAIEHNHQVPNLQTHFLDAKKTSTDPAQTQPKSQEEKHQEPSLDDLMSDLAQKQKQPSFKSHHSNNTNTSVVQLQNQKDNSFKDSSKATGAVKKNNYWGDDVDFVDSFNADTIQKIEKESDGNNKNQLKPQQSEDSFKNPFGDEDEIKNNNGFGDDFDKIDDVAISHDDSHSQYSQSQSQPTGRGTGRGSNQNVIKIVDDDSDALSDDPVIELKNNNKANRKDDLRAGIQDLKQKENQIQEEKSDQYSWGDDNSEGSVQLASARINSHQKNDTSKNTAPNVSTTQIQNQSKGIEIEKQQNNTMGQDNTILNNMTNKKDQIAQDQDMTNLTNIMANELKKQVNERMDAGNVGDIVEDWIMKEIQDAVMTQFQENLSGFMSKNSKQNNDHQKPKQEIKQPLDELEELEDLEDINVGMKVAAVSFKKEENKPQVQMAQPQAKKANVYKAFDDDLEDQIQDVWGDSDEDLQNSSSWGANGKNKSNQPVTSVVKNSSPQLKSPNLSLNKASEQMKMPSKPSPPKSQQSMGLFGQNNSSSQPPPPDTRYAIGNSINAANSNKDKKKGSGFNYQAFDDDLEDQIGEIYDDDDDFEF